MLRLVARRDVGGSPRCELLADFPRCRCKRAGCARLVLKKGFLPAFTASFSPRFISSRWCWCLTRSLCRCSSWSTLASCSLRPCLRAALFPFCAHVAPTAVAAQHRRVLRVQARRKNKKTRSVDTGSARSSRAGHVDSPNRQRVEVPAGKGPRCRRELEKRLLVGPPADHGRSAGRGGEVARALSLATRRLRSLGRFSSYRKACDLRKAASSYAPASDSNRGSRDCASPVHKKSLSGMVRSSHLALCRIRPTHTKLATWDENLEVETCREGAHDHMCTMPHHQSPHAAPGSALRTCFLTGCTTSA